MPGPARGRAPSPREEAGPAEGLPPFPARSKKEIAQARPEFLPGRFPHHAEIVGGEVFLAIHDRCRIQP